MASYFVSNLFHNFDGSEPIFIGTEQTYFALDPTANSYFFPTQGFNLRLVVLNEKPSDPPTFEQLAANAGRFTLSGAVKSSATDPDSTADRLVGGAAILGTVNNEPLPAALTARGLSEGDELFFRPKNECCAAAPGIANAYLDYGSDRIPHLVLWGGNGYAASTATFSAGATNGIDLRFKLECAPQPPRKCQIVLLSSTAVS